MKYFTSDKLIYVTAIVQVKISIYLIKICLHQVEMTNLGLFKHLLREHLIVPNLICFYLNFLMSYILLEDKMNKKQLNIFKK